MKTGRKIDPRALKYDKQGLIPAIIQDYKSGEVLMLAYMNCASLKISLRSKRTCFWSRSRKKFWVKGETSGHFQHIKSVAYDCDKDTLLIKVRQVGAACHTGNHSCFYRKIAFKVKGKKKAHV
ncbi:MAG: phosphoribosyl-AMP cyclohydrolase [Candidatus Omnitrophica bacterium]|nr:phosphoribosyl-AMP cyclohydrolase [Candidatus Omnitrophota bacterium]